MNPAILAAVPENARFALIWTPAAPDPLLLPAHRPSIRRLLLLAKGDQALAAWQAALKAASLLHDPAIRLMPLAESPGHALLPLPPEDDVFLVEGRVACHIDDSFRREHPELCAALEQALLERVRAVLASVAGRTLRGWHIMANSILNLPRLARSSSLELWRNAAKGRAAVVVGAGPSLDKNVHELAAFRDKVFIVACDAALATLRRNNITPDLVASTDHKEKVWRFFTGPDLANVPVACAPCSAWPLLRHLKNPLFVGITPGPRDQLFNKLFGPLPNWNMGQSVGHAAFELACLADADPIILIGFDLGYAGDRFHARDMATPYFHDSPPEAANVLEAPGALGGMIRTDVSMLLYLREFEKRFAACGRYVWDATEGGAAKAGTRVVPLRQALEEAPLANSRPSPPPLKAKPAQHQRLRHALTKWRQQAENMITEARSVIDDLPGELQRFQKEFPFQSRNAEILDLISGANNPVAVTRFKFELEDWLKVRPAAPAPPQSLLEAGRNYLDDLVRCAGLVPELVGIALNQTFGPAPNPAVILSVCRDNSSDERWRAMLKALQASGLKILEYAGDPDDACAVWKSLRETGAGAALMLEGALFPASWAVPGTACIDLRLTLPGADAFLEQWHWLPGYAVVGADLNIASAWRERAPADCPVHVLLPDGNLATATGRDIIPWPEALSSLIPTS